MKEKTMDTANGVVHYWISEKWDAARETMVFLHGITADHTMFEGQIAYFSGIYNLIAWDAPAHGKSRPYLRFSYGDAVECLKTILISHQVDAAVFVGQSFGGFVAQSFLLRYPQMVKGFIGIDTTPYGTAYYSKSDIWWLRQVEWMARSIPRTLLKKSLARNSTASPQGYHNMLSMLEPYGKEELCRLLGIGYAGFLQENQDMTISCPVLLLLGEKDNVGKVKQYNWAWARDTGYPLIVIKHAAHNSNVDQPEAVNREITQFMQAIQRDYG
ncbi:MAG: alpha/beta hydrolase [Eubacteriales bacterium]|nr:alpha/beta hydrolase [Eubacteriales bacterium]